METALTRVSNDILQAPDSKQSVLLVLLDMSAAFDTIDHTILLNTLEVRYGIAGTAHQWFRSYLSDRSQKVRILGKSSDSRILHLGVPQGSVLGPVIFTLYSAQVANIALSHGLRFRLYADDTQLYISFSSGEAAVIVARVECCLAEIIAWLVARDPYSSVIGHNGNGWCPGTHRNETINVPFLVNNISHETSQFPKFCLGLCSKISRNALLILSYHRASRHLIQRRIDTKWVPGQITHCIPTDLWISFKPPYKKTTDVQAFNKHHPAIFTLTLHLLLIFQTHTPPVLRNYTFSVTTQLWRN